MKTLNIAILFAAAAGLASCIDEVEPKGATATEAQIYATPTAFQGFVDNLTTSLSGQFIYGTNEDTYPYDFGYPSMMLMRDVMGQDVVSIGTWFSFWYQCYGLRANTRYAQYPWTVYYGWIKTCNIIIGSDVDDRKRIGIGKAYATRAMLYSDLAQYYATKTYALDKSCITVPIIDENTTPETATHNPNATNEQIWEFILSDLDKAEELLQDSEYNVYDMSLPLVYGLKARAYLIMQRWAEAEKYAKLAQRGVVINNNQWTDRMTGFNTPDASWIFAVKYNSDDPNIRLNDGDSSWGAQMCIEISPVTSACGYAANYGQPFSIDRHLFESIPESDIRRGVFVDFAVDEMTKEDAIAYVSRYSDHPDWIVRNGNGSLKTNGGGLELKFRPAGGEDGRDDQMKGFAVSVPLMRVEEMMLIEAEAAGMQDEGRGIALLTEFAQTRDKNYVYGKHNEAYGSSSIATPFQNEIWWQRRVELWGEGFGSFDMKRYNKGIIRSYENTNHPDGYQWNTATPAEWMTLIIPDSERNTNLACEQTATPVAPSGNSAPTVIF